LLRGQNTTAINQIKKALAQYWRRRWHSRVIFQLDLAGEIKERVALRL